MLVHPTRCSTWPKLGRTRVHPPVSERAALVPRAEREHFSQAALLSRFTGTEQRTFVKVVLAGATGALEPEFRRARTLPPGMFLIDKLSISQIRSRPPPHPRWFV